MLGDTVVVVPNSKLAGSVITNMSLPKEELAVTIDVGVDYGCNLDRVETVTLEVARDVMACVPGAIPGFEPRMRFHTFGDSSVNFTAWLRAKDYISGMALKHEFIKRLHSRYGREGIGIPFPTRTIDLPETTIAKVRQIIVRPREFDPPNGTRTP
jgi:small-conductance mechanosensitive channel